MADCDYCEASFTDEDAYLDHLAEHHADELSRIDQRRVGSRLDDDDGGVSRVALGAAVIGALAVVALGWTLVGGDDGPTEPYAHGSVHEHGTIAVTIDGEQLDFSEPQYIEQDQYWHFHDYDADDSWHLHGQDVTLTYALGTLGIDATGDKLTYDGTTYEADDPDVTLRYEVNGESVDPEEYTFSEGDDVLVVVEG